MKHMRIKTLLCSSVLAGVLALSGCAAGGTASQGSQGSGQYQASAVLDPSDPVQIELWTYYNGTQQQAFEALVEQFNTTQGKELGVVVDASSQGSVMDLATAAIDSAQEKVGSEAMPDAFLAYSDAASVVDGLGKVADLSPYLTDEEKASYVDSFMAEADLSGDGSLKLFPVAKSTETLQINYTDWQKFAEATGSTLEELSTIEGVTAQAQRYWEWSDAQTPDVAGDGSAFFGRDAMANYLICGSRQLGHEILNINNGRCTFELDDATLRALWDNYYVPIVQGWFSNEGRFRSDAVKTGDLICYVGSSSSVVYFPQTVTVDDETSYPIEMAALQNPTFAQGTPCSPQQGASFVVTKSSEKREAACVEFLKWFTAKDQNTGFALSAGYVPVTKEALTYENLETAAREAGDTSKNYVANLAATLNTIDAGLYTNPPFEGGADVRGVLDNLLVDCASTDRAAVEQALASGVSRDEALAPYVGDEAYQAWVTELETQLNAALGN